MNPTALPTLVVVVLGLAVQALSQAGTGGYIVAWGSNRPFGMPEDLTSGNQVARVAAGGNFILVQLTTGELRGYGNNYYGQIAIPPAAKMGVKDFSAGYQHSLAVLANGTVMAWGWNDDNQTALPSNLQGAVFKLVAGGYKHSVAVKEDGTVVAWGSSAEWGQATVPASLTGSNATAIAAGSWASAAVLDNGTLVQWGSVSPVPPEVTDKGIMPGPFSLAIGLDHMTALLADGSVAVWPAARNGPAYRDALNAVMLVPKDALSNAVAIGASDNVSMALLSTGEVLVWGMPYDEGTLKVPAAAKSGVVAIGIGNNYAVAVLAPSPPSPPAPPTPPAPPPVPPLSPGEGGFLFQWGENAPFGIPPDLLDGSKVAKVSAGRDHILVQLTTGELRGYGANGYGQITIPSAAKQGAIDFSCGYDHSLVVTATGAVMGMGWDEDKQSTIPSSLQGVKVKQVAAGFKHSVALTENGTVVAWGSSVEWGQATVPRSLLGRNATAIAAGSWTSAAVLDDGTLVQWGSVSLVPQSVTDKGIMPGPLSVAIGLDHVIALLADGSVAVWPAARSGPAFRDAVDALMLVPDTAQSNVVAVAAKTNISVALTKSGQVVVWGTPADASVLKVPSAANANVTAIAAGDNYVAVLRRGPAPTSSPPSPSPAPGTSPAASPAPPSPAAGSTISTTIAFTLSILANTALATNSTEQTLFGSQLQAAIASYLNVPPSQVQLTLQVAPASRRRVLQSGPTTTLQVAAQVAASWATSDTATRDALRQQVTQLGQTPGAVFPAAMVQQYGIQQVSLQGPVSTTPGTLFDVSPSPPSPAPAPSSGGGSSKVPIIAGVVAGVVVVLLATIGGVFWWRRKKNPPSHETSRSIAVPEFPDATKGWAPAGPYDTSGQQSYGSPFSPAGSAGQAFMVAPETQVTHVTGYSLQAGGPSTRPGFSNTSPGATRSSQLAQPQPSGIMPGDPFLHTASQLIWTDYKPGPHTVRVEQGINDMQLDARANEGSPAIEMTNFEFKQEIEILANGLVGKGGAALVFMCRWPSRFGPDALLAAKVLKNAYDASPSILQTFAYEAKLLASIKHDHVVRLYGYCLELPTVCLIMELLPGSLEDLLYDPGHLHRFSQWGTLTSRMMGSHTGASTADGVPKSFTDTHNSHPSSQDHQELMPATSSSHNHPTAHNSDGHSKQLSMLQVLQVCVDVAAGLDYLHNRQLSSVAASLAPTLSSCNTGHRDSFYEDTLHSLQAQLSETQSAKVAHRDLKPANVLLNSRGRGKLSDFGLARENPTTTVHTVHVGAGTLHYMAPELLASRGPGVLPTNRVDIYSLGIMMWEMVAGKKPWSGLNPMQLQMAVAAKKRPVIPDKEDRAAADGSSITSMPASFYAVPGFVDLVRACWRQRDHKRPPASEVHGKLCAMLKRYGAEGAV